MQLARYSIGTKIFGAFIAMSLIIAAMGLAGYAVLSAAGDIAVTTFDGPLMAINYARAAQSDFDEMRIAQLRYRHADDAARPAISAHIADLASTFDGDLEVAAQRSFAADEQKTIAQIGPLVHRWLRVRQGADTASLAQIDQAIDDKFDMLIELNTDHSFVGRRQTVSNIAYYKYATIGSSLLALLLACGITLFLSRRIIRPLAAAAQVADRIAKGELQTPIPPGEDDETGALLNSMTVMQDNIREMVARETAMRHSAENRLTDALETSREGVMLVAPDGNIVLANSQLSEFFPGIVARLAAGTPFDRALEFMQNQISNSGHDISIDTSGHAELELADGRWLRMTSSSTSEGGSILFLSDFTAIKEREESFRRATHEAEAANASKTRFLANMSHELRTPLNAIIGFSEVITGQLFGALGNARYLDYSMDILRSGRHLLAVINSVLDLSKSEAGKMVLNINSVDMREVLGECIAMVREQCGDAGLKLTMTGMEDDLSLTGDAAKLRQIFLNLLSNAIKFTQAGGEILISARGSVDIISVLVSDTGIGMNEEDLEIAFQPFGQVDSRLERRYEGTGLGLPLTKALIDLHGGSILVDSARSAGTRITVRLPRNAVQELINAGDSESLSIRTSVQT
jgi:signal transduction histidine kinase/HAMP domain-containing protein